MRNLEKEAETSKGVIFLEKKMKISSRQSGAVGLERGFSLMMEKYPFQKKSENKVRETCSSGYLRVSCPETAGGKGTERGRVFFFGTVGCIFPKVKVECVCVCLTFLLFGNVKSFISGPFVLHSAGDLVSTFSELKT